jgi:uncharacterized membrane-anchored protein
MSLNFLSVYDYLSYIVPGAVVLTAGWYAFLGAKYQEPGVFASIALVVLAYVAGLAVAAIWYWAEPILWRHPPLSRLDRTWGLIGRHGVYPEEQRNAIQSTFAGRYRAEDFATNYDLGYAEIQESEKGNYLLIFNQQLGLLGHLAAACVIGSVLIVVAVVLGTASVYALWWAVVLCGGSGLFAARYKYFWKRIGDQVVRQVRLMATVPITSNSASSMQPPAPGRTD